MFTCLCNFSANKKKEIKLHKLFDCELKTKQAKDENVSTYKKKMSTCSKINKLFGGTPIRPTNTLPKKKKTNVSKSTKLLLVSPVSEKKQSNVRAKKRKMNSTKIYELFGGTPINETKPSIENPYSQTTIGEKYKYNFLSQKNKTNDSKSSNLLLVSSVSEKIDSTRFNELFGVTPINETNTRSLSQVKKTDVIKTPINETYPPFLTPIKKSNVSKSSKLLLVSPVSEKKQYNVHVKKKKTNITKNTIIKLNKLFGGTPIKA